MIPSPSRAQSVDSIALMRVQIAIEDSARRHSLELACQAARLRHEHHSRWLAHARWLILKHRDPDRVRGVVRFRRWRPYEATVLAEPMAVSDCWDDLVRGL